MGKERIPDKSQRLSRTERRALEREQKKEMASKSFFERHAKKIYASAVATIGGALVGGGVIFLRGQDGRTPLPPTAIAQQFSAEQTQVSYNAIIAAEIKRLGIVTSIKEKALWEKGYKYNPLQKLPINDETMKLAAERVEQVLELMRQSENPYFKEAVTILDGFVDSGDASIGVYKRGINSGMKVGARLKDGKLHWQLGINADEILNNSSAILVATVLTHEAKHITNGVLYQKTLDASLPQEQRLEKDIQRNKNRADQIIEEASAYAKGAEAFIYQFGLLGTIPESIGTSHQDNAVMYSTTGRSATSERWEDYISTVIDSSSRPQR